MVRGITTGGSTVHYYATCYPVPLDLFKSHGIDITKEVEETVKELPVAPLKDEMVGPMAKRIMESAQDLGYGWQKLDKFMYQDRWKPEYKFGHYGDPHGVKWSARMYIEEAVANGATLINDRRSRGQWCNTYKRSKCQKSNYRRPYSYWSRIYKERKNSQNFCT
jgi:hypothetical protein